MKKSDNQGYTIIFIFTLLFALAAVISFSSCKVTKDIEQEVQTTSVVTKVNVDSIVKIKVDSTAKFYIEFYSSLESDVVFNDCDTVFVPGKERVINTVKYIPGKGFEVSGDIKHFKLKESELLKQIDEITIEKEMETNLRMSLEDSVKAYKFLLSKEVERKTKSLWWLWYSLGAATILFIYNRKKIISLIKKFK